MGFSNVASSQGAYGRAAAELNLLTNENKKRLRVDNSVADARGRELDGRANETADSTKKYVDVFLQKEAAKAAKEAAKYGLWGSITNGVTKLASNLLGDSTWFKTVTDAIGDSFSALGGYFAMIGARQEVELLELQFGQLSDDVKADKQMVAALDGNPTL